MALTLEQLPLQDDEYAVGSLVFGNADRTRDIFVTNLDHGTPEVQDQDQDNPQADTTRMGRDYLRGPTWTFRLIVDTDSETAALAAFGRLAAVWNNRELMRTPGATTPLVYRTAGRTRRVYGRPRSLGIVDRSGQGQGVIEVLASFKTADPLHYAESEESVTITLVPVLAGGLQDPLKDPLTSAGSPPRAGLVVVAGDGQTPFTVTFTGPVTNPAVSAPGWRVGLRGTLNHDQTATVDTRTGEVRLNGAAVGGMLSHDTYLVDARLQPGAQEILFEGVDATGTATARVAWRTATDGF